MSPFLGPLVGWTSVREYHRVGHDLTQKGGIHEYSVVNLCELLLVAQLLGENLVFARDSEHEREDIFAKVIVTG